MEDFVVDSNDDEFIKDYEDRKLIKPQANNQAATPTLCGGTVGLCSVVLSKCTFHWFLKAL